MEARSDRASPSQASSNPIVIELSKPETLTDSERQLRLLICLKAQLNNNLVDFSEVISPLVKLVASHNATVKVGTYYITTYIVSAGGVVLIFIVRVNVLYPCIQANNLVFA